MSIQQRSILAAGLFACALMAAYPPWLKVLDRPGAPVRYTSEYGWLADPPHEPLRSGEPDRYAATVDLGRLAAQWAAALAAAAGLCLLSPGRVTSARPAA